MIRFITTFVLVLHAGFSARAANTPTATDSSAPPTSAARKGGAEPRAPGSDGAGNSSSPAQGGLLDGSAPVPIDRLIEALADDSFKVRLQAAVLLGRSNDTRAIQPLRQALTADEHFTVRAAAATALSNLKDARAAAQIIKLMALDTEPFVREEASRALFRLPRAEALPHVVSTLNWADPRVRKEALTYIVLELDPLVEPVLAKALGDAPEISDIAKQTVRKMPQADVYRFLAAAIEHRDPTVRRGALEVLRSMGTPPAAQLVLRVYERDIEEDEVRTSARTALRELREHLPLDRILREASSSSEKHTRARALRLLGVLGGSDAEKVLTAAVSDDDQYVRGNAVMALGDLGNSELVSFLEKAADDPANQRIVHLIRHTLKQLRTKRANDER